MITFKSLEKDDFSIIGRYLLLDKTRSCEKTAGALMMWRDFYKIEWAIFDETLIIKYNNEEKPFYMMPIGANVDGAIEALGNVAYTGVCKEHFGKFGKNAEFIPVRENFDYIYEADSFRTYAGKRLHSKRNFVNRFKATYKYEFLFDSDVDELVEFFEKIDEKQPHLDETGIIELRETIDLLQSKDLLEIHTGTIKVDGQIVAATIGAQIDDTLYINVEKADKDYIGAYPMIASEFAKAFPSALYINREDDLGEEGLRLSKLSYKPLCLLEKYIVINK